MRSLKLILIPMSAIILFFSCLPVHASETLTILRAGEWKPYHYTHENGNPEGFLIDILKGASTQSGIKIEIKFIPSWSRCLYLMRTGKADAFMPLFKTSDREVFMDFYDDAVLTHEEDNFFSAEKDIITFDGDLRNLKNYIIGTVKGYSYGQEFDQADYLSKVPVENESILLKLLLVNKRYDLILGDRRVIMNHAEEMNLDTQIKIIPPPVVNAPLYIGFSKATQKAGRNLKFVKGISLFKKTDAYSTIIKSN